MELAYDFDKNGNIVNVRFEGLDGRERVTSLKQALTVLQVRNPAVAFTENVKSGLYDHVSDEEYERMLHTVEAVSLLWRYKEDQQEDKSTQLSMNALMLLANAIETIGRQSAGPQEP